MEPDASTLVIERGAGTKWIIECDPESGLFDVMNVVHAIDGGAISCKKLLAGVKAAIRKWDVPVVNFMIRDTYTRQKRLGATKQQLVTIVRRLKAGKDGRNKFLARYDTA